MKPLPRYPVYVISKGRADRCLTAKFLVRDSVPFKLVVEPQEEEAYSQEFSGHLIVTPFSNLGLGSIPARNFVWEHSKAAGAEKHWILDDNIRLVFRRWEGRKIKCDSSIALRVLEDFADRYENVAITGMNYEDFMPNKQPREAFTVNVHVYSALLIDNALPYRWRGRYNEDTDLCLQVLSGGLCTVLVNAFLIDKMQTMTMSGGNTDELYAGDGRLKMARSLERAWPGVVTTRRRFGRPQHVVKASWKGFNTPLKKKPGVKIPDTVNEYGMKLVEHKPSKNREIRKLVRSWDRGHA